MATITRRGFLGLLGAFAASCALPVLKAEPIASIPSPTFNGKLISTDPSDSSLWGLRYWQVPDHSGSWMGIERSSYPGRLSGN